MTVISARVPTRVEQDRTWATANLETMRIERQTILFLKVWAGQKGGEITLATLHLSDADVLNLIRALVK